MAASPRSVLLVIGLIAASVTACSDTGSTTAERPADDALDPVIDVPEREPEAVPPQPTPTPIPVTHTVAAGDTPATIADRYSVTVAELLDANDLAPDDLLAIDQVLVIPEGAVVETAPDEAGETPVDGAGTYTVVAGDTPASIADRYGVNVAELLDANGLTTDDLLQIDQVLVLPEGATTDTAPPTPTPTAEPDEASTPEPAPVSPSATPLPDGATAYTVVEGDFPADIAARFGISTESLLTANGLTADAVLQLGQVLVIPPTN